MEVSKTQPQRLNKTARQEQKKLVKLLKELQGEIQTRSTRRRYSPFPFGQLERGVAHMLDVFENRLLHKRWAEQKLKRVNR